MKLGDLCSFERGLTYSKGDEVDLSTKGVLRSNNVDLTSNTLNFGEIKYLKEDIDIPVSKKVKRNSLLMCMSNGSKAHLGKVAIIEDDLDYAFGGFMGLLIPNEEIVFPRYFYYALITPMYKLYIKGLSDGANINNLKFADLKEFDIPVPPLFEQQRIVALLDAEFAKIDALKANAEKNLQNAKDLFQAALKKELEPKEGWKKSIVGNVCSIISGYAFDSQGYSSNENDTLLICGDNIVHCAFRWETIKRWNKDKYENLRRFAIQENDIVLAMDRPWVKSGLKIAKVSKRELPSLLIQRTACIRAKEGIESEFIYFALQNDAFSKYLIEQQTGVGVPHISGKQIMNYEISLPSLPIQQSIVSRLDTLNEKCKALQANYEKTLSLCDDLKQALLRKAFNGEI